jgi:holin-like protein
MIRGIFLLLLCQLVGEVLARTLNLPAPGPVIGLALLTGALVVWSRRGGGPPEVDSTDVGKAANILLASLSLLFVPAGVGVVQYFDLLARYGLALGVSLIVSTLATLLATVGVFLWVKRLVGAAA